MRIPLFKLSLLVIVLISSRNAGAQSVSSFKPFELYAKGSNELLRPLLHQLQTEYPNLGDVNNKASAQQLCFNRSHYLMQKARKKFFIKNERLENLLSGIIHRIVEANDLSERSRMVLILNSPDANALCYGRGLFVVNIGLLSKVHNEDELAFVLSHELAHDELRHVQENIIREADNKQTANLNAQIRKVLSDDGSVEDVEAFRKSIYDISAHSRDKEIEADSMGLVIYEKSGYNIREAVNSLFTLDSAYQTSGGIEELFAPLTFAKFEFQEYWLKPRLAVYGQKVGSTPLISIDSLESHPELQMRREIIASYFEMDSFEPALAAPGFVNEFISGAEFQVVESAYMALKYDKALFQILMLMNKYPADSYIVARCAKILIDIAEAKNENLLHQYVSRFTVDYSDQLKAVNSFLYNITKEEAAELAFNLLNDESNFNKDEPSHYFLLWKLCQLTRRDQVGRNVQNAYKEKFHKSLTAFEYK